MKQLLIPVLLIFFHGASLGQDLHFSQFYNSQLNVNPASTGVFTGAQRFKAGYRTQWSNVVPWNTFSASYDRKFLHEHCEGEHSFFAAGAVLNYDRSSEFSELTLSNINLTGSYTHRLNNHNLLTMGVLLGFASRGFDDNTLTWDKQWDVTSFSFNRGISSGETFDSDVVSYMETGLGINYRWQKNTDTKFDIGLGIFHLIEPSVGFYDRPDIHLPRRYSLSAVGHFRLSEAVGLQAFGLLQFQDPHRETVLGGLAKLYVDRNPGRRVEVHFGIGHRFNVAWFPIFAVRYNNFYGSISYDIDVSCVTCFEGNRPNTLEIHFGYLLSRPEWEHECPVY